MSLALPNKDQQIDSGSDNELSDRKRVKPRIPNHILEQGIPFLGLLDRKSLLQPQRKKSNRVIKSSPVKQPKLDKKSKKLLHDISRPIRQHTSKNTPELNEKSKNLLSLVKKKYNKIPKDHHSHLDQKSQDLIHNISKPIRVHQSHQTQGLSHLTKAYLNAIEEPIQRKNKRQTLDISDQTYDKLNALRHDTSLFNKIIDVPVIFSLLSIAA